MFNKLKQRLTRKRQRRYFDLELELIDDFPPAFLTTLFQLIEDNPVEGVYRVSPQVRHLEEAIQDIEDGIKAEIKDVHLGTGIIKTFLRRIPGGLLKTGKEEFNLSERGQFLLDALINHLRKLSEEEDKTRMDAMALATCIGPSLINNPGNAIDSAREGARLLLERLIDNDCYSMLDAWIETLEEEYNKNRF